jgi:hypothetical protein
MYGYGQTSKTNTGSADRLRQAATTVKAYENRKATVITQRSGVALCHKDSGGPLVVNISGRNRLVGITSGGVKYSWEQYPGLSTLGQWFSCNAGRQMRYTVAGSGGLAHSWIKGIVG